MGSITLLTGGSRSGKSTYALKLAKGHIGSRMFIATAVAFDDEMRARIDKHRLERQEEFVTIEAPYDLSGAIVDIDRQCVVVVDCLTVWLGNLFYKYENDETIISRIIDELCNSILGCPFDLIFVTNEVGTGIVPDNLLARSFRDIAGILNQKIAAIANTVYLCCCGIPVKIK